MSLSWSENSGYQQTLNLLAKANGIELSDLTLDGDPGAKTEAMYEAVAEKLGLETSGDLTSQMTQIRELAKTPEIQSAVADLIQNDAGKAQAVIAFAIEDSALEADGAVGPKTNAALERYNASVEAQAATNTQEVEQPPIPDTPQTEPLKAGIVPDLSGVFADIEFNEFDAEAYIGEVTQNPIHAEIGSVLAEEANVVPTQADGETATFESSSTVFDGIAEVLVNQGNLEANGGTLSLEEAARTIHYAGTDEANWAETGFGMSEVGALSDRARMLAERSDVIPDELDVNDPAQLEMLVSGVTVVNNWQLYGDTVRENGLDPVKALKTPISEDAPNWGEQISTAVDGVLGVGEDGQAVPGQDDLLAQAEALAAEIEASLAETEADISKFATEQEARANGLAELTQEIDSVLADDSTSEVGISELDVTESDGFISLVQATETQTPVNWSDTAINAATDISIRAQELNPAQAEIISTAMEQGHYATAMHLSMRALTGSSQYAGNYDLQNAQNAYFDSVFVEGMSPEDAMKLHGQDAALMYHTEDELINHGLLNPSGAGVSIDFPKDHTNDLIGSVNDTHINSDVNTSSAFADAGAVTPTPAALTAPNGLVTAYAAPAAGIPQTMDADEVQVDRTRQTNWSNSPVMSA